MQLVHDNICTIAACCFMDEKAGAACLSVVVHQQRSLAQVRRHAAEQLYVQLLAESEDVDPAPVEALDLLAGCSWDGDLAAAKANRQQLYPLLGLPPPPAAQPKKVGARGTAKPGRAGSAAGGGAAAGGEQTTYQLLIDAASRHR